MKRTITALLLLFLGVTSIARADVATDVALWQRLRDDRQPLSFNSAAQFLKRRPHWPQATFIRTRAEHALLDRSPAAAEMITWFTANTPQSDRGRLAYWQALRAYGETAKADALMRGWWREGFISSMQQQTILQSAPRIFTSTDHAQRLDTLLWQGNLERAAATLPLVSGETKAIAQARIALQRFSSNAPQLLAKLSRSALQQDGVLFDRVCYNRQKNNDTLTVTLLDAASHDVNKHAAQWARERAIMARRALDEHNYQRAYNLAAGHGFTGGAELADAEWLAGWIAVSRLNQPQKALQHFDRMYRNVKTSISTARAAYWAGVAEAQMNRTAEARKWYGIATRHMNTFYGQMAAYALGQPEQAYAAFFARSVSPSATIQPMPDVIEAAAILHRAGRDEERDLFLRTALNELITRKQPQAIITTAQRLQSPEIALAAAKAAYENGVLIRSALFPTISVPQSRGVEPSLALGIIRQESMFDRTAVSTANARGLMQLLPSTAAHIARRNGIAHNSPAQLFQPSHNMQLGQAYLAGLLDRYEGFVPLAVAAYNAGPGNVDNWVSTMGDPRRDPALWVDWVEQIPFYETRNYVQRVWEAYSLYKYMK